MSAPPANEGDFEYWFGTDQEHEAEMQRMAERDRRLEAECVAGTRLRCPCGAPSIFVDEHGPLCAPCGYHYAD